MDVADIVANFVPGVQLFICIFDIVSLFGAVQWPKYKQEAKFGKRDR